MKTGLLASVLTTLALTSGVAASSNAKVTPARDSRIIVEVKRGLEGLDEEGIIISQDSLINKIRQEATTNIKLNSRYTILNNAIVLDVNKDDIELIKAVKGVGQVDIDSLHYVTPENNDDVIYISKEGLAEGEVENISAKTMEKSNDTNDGEGTLIAILDNEFFFRGTHTEDSTCSFKSTTGHNGESIGHEVFTPLDSSVATKMTYDSMSKIIKTGTLSNSKGYAVRANGKTAGEEGSCYYNNKVPFYFDYGGESDKYSISGSDDIKVDWDVSSVITYHGSHVASIAAANAPTYKGIAPKAQLACMKVFTNYKATDVGENLGFATSSGAYDTCILHALEDCIKLGVDGINMSLGSNLDEFDSNSICNKTISRMVEEGIMTAISAGNAGKLSYASTGAYGNWTTDMVETGILGSYATVENAMQVASGQPDEVYYETAIKIDGKNCAYDDQIVNREGYDAEYTVEYKLEDLKTTLGKDTIDWFYVPNFGTASDYELVVDKEGKQITDFSNKVAVVNRGSINFSEKYNTAVDLGCAALIIINNDPTATYFNFRCSFGDGFDPSMPCSLVLFKDKKLFEEGKSGTFTFISKEISDNDQKRTVSTFSSDGALFDYELKPEITAPGDNIRGAVPPQKKEDKGSLTVYEYLSGTSMSAPNYAGAQSVILSKVTKDAYAGGKTPTTSQLEKIAEYRDTVNMRLMSTASPMIQDNEKGISSGYTSPRIQGAGMVNLDGAYHTDVYLEGYARDGETLINKSKVSLYDSSNSGNLDIKFLAHNESSEARTYTPKLVVMRPDTNLTNDVIQRTYDFKGEVEEWSKLPTNASINDAYKVTKGTEEQTGYFYCSAINGGVPTWTPVPKYLYQSAYEKVIDTITLDAVTIPANSEKDINVKYSLSKAAKDEIASIFPYGCALEGYVMLDSGSDTIPDLSIPYLGFYGNETEDGSHQSYSDAPIAEPFSFEKNKETVYPSELVNSITKSLLGKDSVEFGSLWLAGYIDRLDNINTDKILTNDSNVKQIPNFFEVGTNPQTGEFLDNPTDNIYVGNPNYSNTMVIQQFILRSVNDNYFTITNKTTGEVVYRDALKDMLFGDRYGRYPLFKSHVDSNYLGAGYVAHRAYAAIPLYDPFTYEPFDDGEYEITFNYQLLANLEWVKTSYTLHIDSSSPTVNSINQYKDSAGKDRVRIEYKDASLAYGVIGYTEVPVQYDSTKDVYYYDCEKSFIDNCISEVGATKSGQTRLFIGGYDYAHGYMGALVHFKDNNNYSGYILVQSNELSVSNDFVINGSNIEFFHIYPNKDEVKIDIVNYSISKTYVDTTDPVPPTPSGCGGNIITSSVLLSTVGLSGVVLVFISLFLNKKYKKEDK